MLVDSGADVTLVPWSLGQHLGFQAKPSERIHSVVGVGGQIQVRSRRLRVALGEGGPVVVMDVQWSAVEVPGLLGRRGIFERYRVEFDQSARKVRFLKASFPGSRA